MLQNSIRLPGLTSKSKRCETASLPKTFPQNYLCRKVVCKASRSCVPGRRSASGSPMQGRWRPANRDSCDDCQASGRSVEMCKSLWLVVAETPANTPADPPGADLLRVASGSFPCGRRPGLLFADRCDACRKSHRSAAQCKQLGHLDDDAFYLFLQKQKIALLRGLTMRTCPAQTCLPRYRAASQASQFCRWHPAGVRGRDLQSCAKRASGQKDQPRNARSLFITFSGSIPRQARMQPWQGLSAQNLFCSQTAVSSALGAAAG